MLYKAVIFDLFGTLTNGQADPERRIIQKFNLDKSKDYSFVEQVVCGTIFESREQYFARLIKRLELPNSQTTLISSEEIFREDLALETIRPEVQEVLKALQFKKVKIGLISDLPNPDYDLVEREGLSRYFDVKTLSYKNGIIKPDQSIFIKTLEKLRVRAEESIMVGNSLEKDIMPAINFGMGSALLDCSNKYPNYHGIKISDLREILS